MKNSYQDENAARERSPIRHLKLCGAGERLHGKHGTKVRRSRRKLHPGMDADTGQIVASLLAAQGVDHGSQVGPLPDQAEDPPASSTGDGAYDQGGVSSSIAARHPEAAIIVPPRATAVPSEAAETAPTQRGRHLRHVEPRSSPDSTSNREVRRTSQGTAAWLGRRHRATPGAPKPRRASRASSR